MLLKPVYEKPIDTAEDIVERGIKIIDIPGRESMVEMLKRSPSQLTRALAENTYVTKVVSNKCHFNLILNISIY